jgi:hypothetical protein
MGAGQGGLRVAGQPAGRSQADNARITKLNLAKRFPLHQVLLKKCAGAEGAAKAAR